MISFEEFKKVELKIGKILTAEKVEGSEKLLKLSVDFGLAFTETSARQGGDIRQVVSGIAKSYEPEKLVGKEFLFTTNLEPRNIMGLESQAMILATIKKGRNKEEVVLMKPVKKVKPGSSLS
ncbi:MAG: methionine--tRNA ligase [Candidatus Paceibacterota bacterium]